MSTDMQSKLKPSLAEASAFWQGKRVIVTGGAGFLGSFVIEKLKQRGAGGYFHSAHRGLQPGSTRTISAACMRTPLKDVDPPDVVVIHLAANVGGIGANREHPAEFFYDNLMMGVELMHQAWKNGVGKFVAIGTVCAYPKFTPVPFKEEDLWIGLSRRDQCALRPGQEDDAGAGAGVSPAVWLQCHLPAAGESVRPA